MTYDIRVQAVAKVSVLFNVEADSLEEALRLARIAAAHEDVEWDIEELDLNTVTAEHIDEGSGGIVVWEPSEET